jgi:hypothetical protein
VIAFARESTQKAARGAMAVSAHVSRAAVRGVAGGVAQEAARSGARGAASGAAREARRKGPREAPRERLREARRKGLREAPREGLRQDDMVRLFKLKLRLRLLGEGLSLCFWSSCWPHAVPLTMPPSTLSPPS